MNGECSIVIDLWEAGRGDCTVITLPDGQLILIDVGGRGCPVVEWLEERRPQPRIAAIVLTHNDADHAGAMPSILAAHSGRISDIWMLQDRPLKSEPFANTFRLAAEEERLGRLRVNRLEAGQEIWRALAGSTTLRAVYPTFTANVSASKPNKTSGLIILEDSSRVYAAWPGDLPVSVVASRLAPSRPRLLHGPHHGGPSDFGKKQRHLCRQAVEMLAPELSFISVSTKNPYSHPRPGYLSLLARHDCRVVCTQITRACDPKHVLTNKPVFDGSGALGLRSPRTGTPCRGALRLRLKNGELLLDEFAARHTQKLATLRRPQCLKGRGWKTGHVLPWTDPEDIDQGTGAAAV